MGGTCPRCGQSQGTGDWCERCGVHVAQYRADLEAAMAASGTAAAAPPPPGPPARAEERAAARRPAGFWIRGAALAVDLAVIAGGYGVLVVVARLVFREAAGGRAVETTLDAFLRLGVVAYFGLLTWRLGQTLGKAFLRLRVVTTAGAPLSLGRALGRVLAHLLSFMLFGIGYVVAGVRSDKRALHDLIAGTRVERVP